MATATAEPVEVLWHPHEGPQEALLSCPVSEVFYGGARGGGKTDGALGDWMAHANLHGRHAAGLLVRRTLVELDAIVERSRELYAPLGWAFNETKKEWRTPAGALLRMRYLKRDADAGSYQGHAYTWICIEEAGNFPTSKPIDLLRGTLRSAHGVPCYLRLTGNPGGPGHGWLKRRYVDPHPDGFQPFAYEVNGIRVEAVFIPSTLDDNPSLTRDEAYHAQLAAATAGDEALFDAWRYGRWDVFVGQMYRLEKGFQVVGNRKAVEYGKHYRWFATMDWGYVQGCFGLHAVDTEGRVELVYEFYDEFTELDARSAAHAIVDALRRHGWPVPEAIHADSQMWQEHGSGAKTLAEEFGAGLRERLGAETPRVVEASHGPGSRATKVALIHQWLKPRSDQRDAQGRAMPWALPYYRISERCANTIRVLQEIPRDPDNPNDVDPDYTDDHCLAPGTLIATDRGGVPIEHVRTTDRVLTRDGWRRVLRSWQTSPDAALFDVVFSDGNTVTMTAAHPVWVEGHGFMRCDVLGYGHRVVTCEDAAWKSPSSIAARFRSGAAFGIGSAVSTSVARALNVGRAAVGSISTGAFTWMPAVPYRTASTSIIATGTGATMRPRIWSSWSPLNTWATTAEKTPQSNGRLGNATSWLRRLVTRDSVLSSDPAPCNKRGGLVRLAAHGVQQWRSLAASARKLTRRFARRFTNTAPWPAVSVHSVHAAGRSAVYNLTVEGTPEFFANGVLVHNCHDMVGFAVASREYPADAPTKVTPEHQHPGLRRDGTRKTREWTEKDETMDWLQSIGKSSGSRYGGRR